MQYESVVRMKAASIPGVVLTVRRMSFGRRLELTRAVKDLAARLDFLAAGEGKPSEQAEAALTAGEIDRVYLQWGLADVEGLEIDGAPAVPESLVERGPEELVAEAIAAIRREAGLSESERKNSKSHSISREEARPDGNATNAAA